MNIGDYTNMITMMIQMNIANRIAAHDQSQAGKGSMTQHYQRNTTGITQWCNTCNRMTIHRVDDRRVGVCTEHHKDGMSKAQKKWKDQQEKDEREPELFEP